jgi:hypothetical protein
MGQVRLLFRGAFFAWGLHRNLPEKFCERKIPTSTLLRLKLLIREKRQEKEKTTKEREEAIFSLFCPPSCAFCARGDYGVIPRWLRAYA